MEPETDRRVIIGETLRLPMSIVRNYPEMWNHTVKELVAHLRNRVARDGLVPLSDITVAMAGYEKHVEATERPDWAADIDPPWFETVECGAPDAETALLTAEVLCAPR